MVFEWFLLAIVTNSFPLKNTGPIPLAYKWTVLDQNGDGIRGGMEPKPLNTDVGTSGKDVLPFSVTPPIGLIPVGQEANLTVRFSPLDLVDMECVFRCK